MKQIIVKSENLYVTQEIANKFGQCIKNGACVCLYGDIGVGKTAFSREVFKSFGVNEQVTSPSFVILNEYKTSTIPIYHFDLYRLENVGVSSVLEEIYEYTSNENCLTFIEWANFSDITKNLPCISINIEYICEVQRKFIFNCNDNKYIDILKEFNKLL